MTLSKFLNEWENDSDLITVHTSGSTGQPKKMLVEKRRMLTSARITCDFLRLKPHDKALLCMPLDYIAGKMMVVRSIERQLQLISVTPSLHPLANVDVPIDFAAMVPSQVFGSMEITAEREKLQNIGNLIIGGGAIPRDLEQQLRSFPNAIWSTYGMTETLSHIALRRISGELASEWYTPFQGVGISLVNNCGDIGQLVIDAPHVCATRLITNDIVEISDNGKFRVIGRTDNVICSGGIKLHIELMEELLHSRVDDEFCITKRKDPKFGEVAVMIVARHDNTDVQTLLEICRQVLPRYAVPKEVIVVDKIPLTETSKINRAEAMRIADKQVNTELNNNQSENR